MRRLVLVLFAAAVAAEPLAERVDRLAGPFVEAGTIVGMVVGVRDGADECVRGYGDPRPGADTVYEIGSISKVFTGVLLASMARDGLVPLDAPVADLLAPGTKVPARGERQITLVDLATHTSGLPRMPDNFAPKDPRNPYADYTVEQMREFLGRVRLASVPGETYAYSNVGAGLLGHALARRAGKSYEELLRERIAGPLGMESTVVSLTPGLEARLAPGHNAAGKPEGNWDLPTFAGAGGIRSTVADMMRFLAANLSREETPAVAALAAAREVRFTPREAGANRMALGWHVSPGGVFWHNGQTGGYHSFVALDTVNGRAVVILSDTATGAVDELGWQLFAMLAGEKVEPRHVRKEVAVEPATLAAYVGTYRLFSDFRLTVTLEDGRLMVQATGQEKFPVFAESETEFFYKVVDARITFEREEDGKVKRLVLHQGGRDLSGIRE